jgi:uncharacterized protein (DUF1499 family)
MRRSFREVKCRRKGFWYTDSYHHDRNDPYLADGGLRLGLPMRSGPIAIRNRESNPGRETHMMRIVLGVCVMGFMAFLLTACAGEPPGNLGVRDGLLAPCPSSPNCVSSRADDKRHRIEPLRFSSDPAGAFARLRGILADRGDTTLVREEGGYLRVEFRTRLGFVDDGEFLLNPDGGCIHVRSASRLGYSDLGKNRSRLEEIRGRFAGTEGAK